MSYSQSLEKMDKSEIENLSNNLENLHISKSNGSSSAHGDKKPSLQEELDALYKSKMPQIGTCFKQ